MRLSSNILIDERQLQLRIEAMATAIAADTPEDITLSVLALMDGAFMFCADLVRRLPMPVRLAFVPMVSVGRGGDPSTITLPAGFPVKGADLLVVEDILDTGETLVRLKSYLANLGAIVSMSKFVYQVLTDPTAAPERAKGTLNVNIGFPGTEQGNNGHNPYARERVVSAKELEALEADIEELDILADALSDNGELEDE